MGEKTEKDNTRCSEKENDCTLDADLSKNKDSTEKEIDESEKEKDNKNVNCTNSLEQKEDKLNNENISMEKKDKKTAEKVDQNKLKDNDNASDEDLKLQVKLTAFLEWSEKCSIKLSEKVEVTFKGTSDRYGMLAKEEIKKGETLFTIPRTILIHADNSSICKQIFDFEEWLEGTDREMSENSGWVPLLLTLMYEYNNENSRWKEYLDLLPAIEEFGHPLFWSSEELKSELKGISLLEDVQRDIANIEEEYKEFIVPFVYRNKDICKSIDLYSLSLYKRMVAFVMAYSFTEHADTSPEMVPMADILNHHNNNNACVFYEDDSLRMISTKKIEKGEEIFNTFGKLGNMSLLQMYGYVEGMDNPYDSISINVTQFINYLEDAKLRPPALIQAMKALLDKTNIAPSYDYFIFDKNGLRFGPDMINMLKILHMPESEFEEMLRTRAGNRPDSFYKKILRKLKLARKTNISSGVAVIDITEEEEDDDELDNGNEIYSEKRKHIDYQEIEDNDEVHEPSSKKSCMYDGSDANDKELSSAAPLNYLLPNNFLPNHVNTIPSQGNSTSTAILIDDESDEDMDSTLSSNKDNDASLIELHAKDSCSNVNNVGKNDEDSENNQQNTIKNNERNNEKDNHSVTEKNSDLVSSEKVSENVANAVDEKSTEKPSISTEKNEGKIEGEQKDDNNSSCKDDIEKNSNNDQKTKTNTKNENGLGKKTASGKDDDGEGQNPNNDGNMDVDRNDNEEKENDEDEDGNEGEEAVEAEGDGEEEDDEDEIEILSEDIRCMMTYEKLISALKDEWKATVKEVLNLQLNAMKQDNHIESEEYAKSTMSRNQFNAYQIRQGQRKVIRLFQAELT